MAKYTTIIMNKDRKTLIDNAKKTYMLDNNLSKLSDSLYFIKLIEYYESKKQ